MSEEVENAEAAVPLKRLLSWVLGKLFREEWLASFVNCKREQTCADGIPVFDTDVTMVSVKSTLRSKGFCLDL